MQLWTMIHKTESLRHKDSQLFRGKIVCLQLQQSSAVALDSTAAAVRQHMTKRHDHIAQAGMVVDGCDKLRNVAI